MKSTDDRVPAAIRPLTWFRENVPCLAACPVKTDAGRYVQLIGLGRYEEAYATARAPNPIASICGRTCGAPCEDACRRGSIDAPVAIRPLKRFVTERFGPESFRPMAVDAIPAATHASNDSRTLRHFDALQKAPGPRRQVAVIGAGPAGLACAHDLAVRGYRVTVFEAMPHGGGMMRYGIPEYRLPREIIDRQVAEIRDLGVEFLFGRPLDADFGIREIRAAGFAAVFLGIGAGRGRDLAIEGGYANPAQRAQERAGVRRPTRSAIVQDTNKQSTSVARVYCNTLVLAIYDVSFIEEEVVWDPDRGVTRAKHSSPAAVLCEGAARMRILMICWT